MRPTRIQAAHTQLHAQLHAGAPVPCQSTTDPEDWWPVQGGDASRTAAAVAACRTCRVLAACRGYAIAAGEEFGVWGGLTPADRSVARRGGAA